MDGTVAALLASGGSTAAALRDVVGELGRDLEPSCPPAFAGADTTNDGDDDEVAEDEDDDEVEAAAAKEDADDGGMKPRGEPSIALADD